MLVQHVTQLKDELDSLTLVTTKHPRSLKGAKFFETSNINLDSIKKQTTVFEGNAAEAVKLFPANINVSVALSLAGFGLDKTIVTIIADPSLKINIHEIVVDGEFGHMISRTENVPSPVNPKTSYLAALSAVATFKRIIDPIKIGT